MDAMEFLKEWGRICHEIAICDNCPFKELMKGYSFCMHAIMDRPEEAVKIVEKEREKYGKRKSKKKEENTGNLRNL